MELTRTERIIQLWAAVLGLAVAGVVSYLIGRSAGVETGVAAFFLSWTFVALFVLLVRFVVHRLIQGESDGPPDAGAHGEGTAQPAGTPRRRRKRRR